MPAYFSSS